MVAMEIITELLELDFPSLIVGFFIILSSIIAIYEIVGKFSKIIGKPVKWVREQGNDHSFLMQTAKKLDDLEAEHLKDVEQSNHNDEMIRQDLRKLTDIFVDKQINDYRWEIINFSNRISNGEWCNQDSYRHCFATYEKYEKLLEENKLENGEVEISMEIINESYKQKLKQGF